MWIVFVLLVLSVLPEIIEVFSYSLPIERPMHCVKVIPLINLRRQTVSSALEQKYYVQIAGNKATFAFDKNKNYLEAYKEKTIRGKIEVHEDEKCLEPTLKVFQALSIWDEMSLFSPCIAKAKYVFYVPKETVLNKQDKTKLQESNVVV